MRAAFAGFKLDLPETRTRCLDCAHRSRLLTASGGAVCMARKHGSVRGAGDRPYSIFMGIRKAHHSLHRPSQGILRPMREPHQATAEFKGTFVSYGWLLESAHEPRACSRLFWIVLTFFGVQRRATRVRTRRHQPADVPHQTAVANKGKPCRHKVTSESRTQTTSPVTRQQESVAGRQVAAEAVRRASTLF